MLIPSQFSFGRLAVWLFTIVAAAAACAMVTISRDDLTPIDRALPLIAVSICLASFLAVRFGEIALTSIPVLTILAVAVPEERMRLLLYGITVAGALMVALCGMIDRASKRIELWRAVGFVVICGALLKAIPVSANELPTLAVSFAGLGLLTFLFSDSLEGGSLLPPSDTDRKAAASRRTPKVSLHVIPVVLAVALITPLEPSRAALFPLVLGCALGFARSSSFLFLAAAAILAIPAGRWALLLVALCAAAPLVSRFWRSGSPLVALPAVKRTWAFLLRMLLFSPASIADAFTAPRPLAVSASLLIIVALLIRPAVALMYLIAAVVLILPLHPSPVRLRLAMPSAIFASVWLTLFAWSGALAPSFPVLSTGTSGPISQVIGRALAAGESVVIQPGAGQLHVFLVTSGSNVASLHPDVAVARLEFADQRGEGFARDVRMEEIADWGAFRPGHFFGTQNELPGQAAMLVDGYGADAFVAGFSRLELKLDQPITSIRVTALPGLPPAATVELHRLELPN